MIRLIQDQTPFAFSRWGDGEWHCVLGHKGRNCDGHSYFTDLGASLAHVLREQSHTFGMQSLAKRTMGEEITKWLQANSLDPLWTDADILHNAAWDGRLHEFTDALKVRGFVLVGPVHLAGLNPLCHIRTSETQAWLGKERILIESMDAMDKYPSAIFVLCCGPMANWLTHVLWGYGHHSRTIIDAGSVFDPWGSRRARTYQKHKDIVAENPGVKW